MYEHFFQCPYCWETISMFLEPVNVEDCEVCCRPIQLIYFFERELRSFEALHLEE